MEQELAFKLQDCGISYRTQVEIPVTTADFYFVTEPRPLLVFVDGCVHLKTNQSIKDEELRTLLRRRGYRVLELYYDSYSDKRRDQLYSEILDALGREIRKPGCSYNRICRSNPSLELGAFDE
jgi:very-short-patch-repair endonuclease